MGDFSKDPKERLADSIKKRYVGVRMQQGVPILDSDWNEMEDIRRIELEDLGKWAVGNGVPVGSDGFRITPVAGGGINNIVLTANSTGIGLSSIRIDIENSTAAYALGFDNKNFKSSRYGSSPAQIRGNKPELFSLDEGSTLVVQADNNPPETVTFIAEGNFVDITAATADEVITVISESANNITASPGDGNDFIIKGGDSTTGNAGRIFVEGKVAINEHDIKYTGQPLYDNDELAKLWGVDPVERLITPTVDEPYLAYIDIWNREVDSTEDPELQDERIGVETTIRLRREWAVRVAKEVDYMGILAAKPPGHSYYKLAQINRNAGDARIDKDMIIDERNTDVSIQRKIEYRGSNGSVLVDSEDFKEMLIENRENIRDFIESLITKFVAPDAAYAAGEVLGINSLSTIAHIADDGIALLNAHSLGTKSTFSFFEQLLEAENRFVSIWKTALFPISKPEGNIYETAFQGLINKIESFLTGPAPVGYITISEAIKRRNLWEAVRAQRRVNSEFGDEIDRPIGHLLVTYLGPSISKNIVKNVPFDLRYKIFGSVTPEDDIEVEISIDSQWGTALKNEDGSLPFQLKMGPGSYSKGFIITVLPPNVNAAETQIGLRVSAKRNHSGLYHFTAPKSLRIGDPPPTSEEDYNITIKTINVPIVSNVLQVPINYASADITFRIYNNTTTDIDADLEYSPQTSTLWYIVKGPFPLNNYPIPANDHRDFGFQFGPPDSVGQSLTFTFGAKDASTDNLLAEIEVSFITVAP